MKDELSLNLHGVWFHCVFCRTVWYNTATVWPVSTIVFIHSIYIFNTALFRTVGAASFFCFSLLFWGGDSTMRKFQLQKNVFTQMLYFGDENGKTC